MQPRLASRSRLVDSRSNVAGAYRLETWPMNFSLSPSARYCRYRATTSGVRCGPRDTCVTLDTGAGADVGAKIRAVALDRPRYGKAPIGRLATEGASKFECNWARDARAAPGAGKRPVFQVPWPAAPARSLQAHQQRRNAENQ